MTERVIQGVDAWEVLDSRGDPTVRVRVETPAGAGQFTVPAGASTGSFEAVERRDGGDRYGGRGVQTVVETIRTELASVVVGRDVTDQAEIDAELVEYDGTPTLSRVGGNAVLGVSGAIAHAAARARELPLYQSVQPGDAGGIPLPMVNLISGGAHAVGGMAVQDILVVPIGATTYPEAIESVWAVRSALRDRLMRAGERPLVADEGGFAPSLPSTTDAFDLVTAAIRDAGYRPARDDMALGIDVAATHFFDGDHYRLEPDRRLAQADMIEEVVEWSEAYPIVSIEDPLAEDAWDGWTALCERVEDVQILGDDLLATNPERVQRAIEGRAASAVLVKPNQAGTITRTLSVIESAQAGELNVVVSARSGETSDATIADLAVATGAGQIKIGSLARSERLAKYNRLFELYHAGVGYNDSSGSVGAGSG